MVAKLPLLAGKFLLAPTVRSGGGVRLMVLATLLIASGYLRAMYKRMLTSDA